MQPRNRLLWTTAAPPPKLQRRSDGFDLNFPVQRRLHRRAQAALGHAWRFLHGDPHPQYFEVTLSVPLDLAVRTEARKHTKGVFICASTDVGHHSGVCPKSESLLADDEIWLRR